MQESFDGIDASMLDIGWDMDVNLLFGDLDAACEVCKTIAANEAHIEEVMLPCMSFKLKL